MSDITKLFKATVKSMKSRNKPKNSLHAADKSILATSKAKTKFSSRANDVVKSIGELHAFLLKHRNSYINANGILSNEQCDLTDADRDQIDSDTEVFIKTCSETIKVFRQEALTDCNQAQMKEHRALVIQLIESYLKDVCKIYSTQRAVRVKRAVDKKRIGRLALDSKTNSKKLRLRDNSPVPTTSDATEADQDTISHQTKDQPEDDLSPEEIQMFEQENEQLFQELNNVVDEVKQIEGKVVEISRLQEIFADKVLEQEKDIDVISDKVVGSTENLKEANNDIREAMRNNAGLRVWILFILIVCTFSLLFLDWYSA